MHLIAFQIMFWVVIGFVAYIYVGYPALVWAWSRMRPHVWIRDSVVRDITVIVVAHNEATRIRRRLRNLLSSDYPADRMEVIVACDGATDATAEVAREFSGHGVRTIEFAQRRGKSAVLDEVIPRAHGEIVVLADVRQRFARSTLRSLVAGFADARVGAVSGELKLIAAGGASQIGEGAGFYWRYEKFIRRNEAIVDSTIGVTGAVYAIRGSLFRRIPPATILDDVLIPMQIVEQGYRVVFEPDAVAYDSTMILAKSEFVRKIRTIGGNFQLFLGHPRLLLPWRNRIWLQTISHKFLRLMVPGLLLLAFGLNLVLVQNNFYKATLVIQVLFYVAAVAGRVMRDTSWKSKLLNVPYTFCVLNWATVIAFIRWVTGRHSVVWDKTIG